MAPSRRSDDDPDARMEAAEPPSEPVIEARAFPGRSRRGQPHHDRVAPELLDELHLAIGKGLALLNLDEGAAPSSVVQAIALYVDAARSGRARWPSDADDARLALACLYGQAIGRELGWGWGHVRCVRKPGLFVISPNRRFVAGPRAIVEEAARVGGQRITAHFATLCALSPQSAVAGVYQKVD